MTEQFMPFVHNYPWDPGRFRFIGSPIDGIQFEEDRVIIVEFKTGSSTLMTVWVRLYHDTQAIWCTVDRRRRSWATGQRCPVRSVIQSLKAHRRGRG